MKTATQQNRLEVFYDAACPLCMREMNWLMEHPHAHRVTFTAIQSLPFGPDDRTIDQLMARMHARTSDGVWIEGVEVFRLLYEELGMGWWVGLSRLPIVRHLLDAGYALFARHRLSLSGRCKGGACCLPFDIDGKLQRNPAR